MEDCKDKVGYGFWMKKLCVSEMEKKKEREKNGYIIFW